MQKRFYALGLTAIMIASLMVLVSIPSSSSPAGPHPNTPETSIPGYYNITISESGLPLNTTWYVEYPGSSNGGSFYSYNTTANTSSSYNHITDFLSNGTFTIYVYTITIGNTQYVPNYGEPSSYITIIVSGKNLTDTIAFTKVALAPAPTYYTITMKINNLPSVINGVSFYWYAYLYIVSGSFVTYQLSYNSTSVFTHALPNGTYYYELSYDKAYFTLSPQSAYFQVSGKNVTISLHYSKPQKTAYYNASITEKGLPTNVIFTAAIDQYAYYNEIATNSTLVSSGTSVSFSLPNGTYYYQSSYSEISGNIYYSSSNIEGSFVINGTGASVSIIFTQEQFLIFQVSPSNISTASLDYSVEVVNINTGSTNTFYSSSLSYDYLIAPGTYYYYVTATGGNYNLSPTFGEAKVSNSNVTVHLTATFEEQYTVTIIEHGLPLSSGNYYWNAEVSGKGHDYSFISSSSNVFSFSVPNGTYTINYNYYFEIPLTPGNSYHAQSSGVTVSGHNITVNATYTPGSSTGASVSLTSVGIPVVAGIVGVAAGAGIAALAFRRRPKSP